MFENFDMLLLIFLTFLSFVSSIVPIVLKPVWMCFLRHSPDEKKMYEEIFHLKAEQQRISMKDNFAAHAKLQRRINKLEDSHKECSQLRRNKNVKTKLFVTYGFQFIFGFAMFATSFWYRNTPLMVFDQSLFPFQKMFSYPNDISNSLSPHAWVIISRISFSSLLKSVS